MYMDQSTPRSMTPSMQSNGPNRRLPMAFDDPSRQLMQQRSNQQHRLLNYENQMMAQQHLHHPRPQQIARRPTINTISLISLVEGKIAEMNKWLTMARANTPRLDLENLYNVSNEARCDEKCIFSWWEKFAEEFFEDDATLRIAGFFGGTARSFVVGKSLISRFFRYSFENGLMQLQYILRQPVNCYPRGKSFVVLYPTTSVRSEYKLGDVSYEVLVNGTLEVECSLSNSRIRSWTFEHSNFKELVDKETLRLYSKNEQNCHILFNNVTDNGLPSFIIQFLEINTVMESIRTLMAHSRNYAIEPMDSLRALIMQSQRNQQSDSQSYREMPPPQQLPSVDSSGSLGRPTSAQSESFDAYGAEEPKKAATRRINTPNTGTRAPKRRTKKTISPGNDSSPMINKLSIPSPSAPNVLLVSEPKLYVMGRVSDDTKTIHRETNDVANRLTSPAIKEETTESANTKSRHTDYDDTGYEGFFADLV